jgi:hypothetical protein
VSDSTDYPLRLGDQCVKVPNGYIGPELDSVALAVDATLRVGKHSLFAGEPLYFSIRIAPDAHSIAGAKFFRGGNLEATSGDVGIESWRGVAAFRIRKADDGQAVGMVCPAASLPHENFMEMPGVYRIHAWLSKEYEGIAFRTPDEAITVRPPTADERRSVTFLAKVRGAFQGTPTNFVQTSLNENDFRELEALLKADPNLPLRDELQVVMAQQISRRLSKSRVIDDEYLGYLNAEISCRASVPVEKRWLRWIAYWNGEFVEKYLAITPAEDQQSVKAWHALRESWSNASPLPPQAIEDQENRFQEVMANLATWCKEHPVPSEIDE